MDPFERSEKRREAQRRLWAKRQRIGQLRSRVVAISFTQLATGNDPVLAPKAAARAASRAASESVETTDAQETRPEESRVPQEEEAIEPEPEPEFLEAEPETETEILEAEPEPEFFEPEPVETTQS